MGGVSVHAALGDRSGGEVAQRRSGQQVQVHVEDGLPGVLAAVHPYPVTVLGQALAAGVIGRRQHQPAQQLGVLGTCVVQGGDGIVLGNEQHVQDRKSVV